MMTNSLNHKGTQKTSLEPCFDRFFYNFNFRNISESATFLLIFQCLH